MKKALNPRGLRANQQRFAKLKSSPDAKALNDFKIHDDPIIVPNSQQIAQMKGKLTVEYHCDVYKQLMEKLAKHRYDYIRTYDSEERRHIAGLEH